MEDERHSRPSPQFEPDRAAWRRGWGCRGWRCLGPLGSSGLALADFLGFGWVDGRALGDRLSASRRRDAGWWGCSCRGGDSRRAGGGCWVGAGAATCWGSSGVASARCGWRCAVPRAGAGGLGAAVPGFGLAGAGFGGSGAAVFGTWGGLVAKLRSNCSGLAMCSGKALIM